MSEITNDVTVISFGQSEVTKVYDELFEIQSQNIIGFLQLIKSDSELAYHLNCMEQKKYLNPDNRQILLLMHFIEDHSEDPVIVVKGARNQMNGNKISTHANKEDYVQTRMNLETIQSEYKAQNKSQINPFRILSNLNDTSDLDFVNKIYYIALLECPLRQLECILINVNIKNIQKKTYTEKMVARRINQILTKWVDRKQ